MEIAIGIVFLALFAGAFFLLILIVGLYFWRRSKRRNSGQNRQFTSAATYGAVGSQTFNRADDDNDYFYTDTTAYSNSRNEDDREASAKMSLDDSSLNFSPENYSGATEGGDYASSGPDYSDSSSTSYESSSSGYDSSSSSDSSSNSDSGSSSSSSSD